MRRRRWFTVNGFRDVPVVPRQRGTVTQGVRHGFDPDERAQLDSNETLRVAALEARAKGPRPVWRLP